MKIKVVDADREDKVIDGKPVYKYTVTNVCKYGTFTSSVKTCFEDFSEDGTISDMNGYDIAQRKNVAKAFYIKATRFKERVVQMQHVYDVALTRFGEGNETTKFLKRQLDIVQRDYKKIEDYYLFLRDGIKEYGDSLVKDRKEFLEKSKLILEHREKMEKQQ